jgi:hypothetical protein
MEQNEQIENDGVWKRASSGCAGSVFELIAKIYDMIPFFTSDGVQEVIYMTLTPLLKLTNHARSKEAEEHSTCGRMKKTL